MNERIWRDQLEFNNQFRENPSSTEALATEETKELVLHLFSECDEVLRASGAWKLHRRQDGRINRRKLQLELADVLKYWMSICQVHGFSLQEMQEAYWEKSMAVRQRYSEEFVKNLRIPSAIVDIDNVLADYIQGFVMWARDQKAIDARTAREFLERPRYVSADSLGIASHKYEKLKHQFRTSRMHAYLPVLPGADALLTAIRGRGLGIILLTSRPIDRYPNLYSETLVWLNHSALPFDTIWWAANKADLCKTWDYTQGDTDGPTRNIVFAIDDEWQYVRQYSEAGIPVYWLTWGTQDNTSLEGTAHTITKAQDLKDLTRLITEG